MFRDNSLVIMLLIAVFMCASVAFGQNAINHGLRTTTTAKGVADNEIGANNDMEQCQAVCVDIFFLLPEDPMSMSACQRGCRMFNIIYLRDDRSLNNSKDECYSSCGDAYAELDLNSACRKGCKNMLRKKQSELEAVIVYIEQDARNLDSPQPDVDELEMTWFIENYAPRELHYNDGQRDYKIPESMYRTLPIETLIEELAKPPNINRPKGDWLDCASRNSGIPRYMLISSIVCAVLVALYLSITAEKNCSNAMILGDDSSEFYLPDSEEEEEQACELLAKVPLAETEQPIEDTDNDHELLLGVGHLETAPQQTSEEVRFSAPPKYSVESERV